MFKRRYVYEDGPWRAVVARSGDRWRMSTSAGDVDGLVEGIANMAFATLEDAVDAIRRLHPNARRIPSYRHDGLPLHLDRRAGAWRLWLVVPAETLVERMSDDRREELARLRETAYPTRTDAVEAVDHWRRAR